MIGRLRAVLLVLLVLLAGCPPAEEGTLPPSDDRPQRIVSLGPNLTEILFAIGAGERVIAVTGSCDHPSRAADRPTVGPYGRPELETLTRLSPDLVLAPEEGPLRAAVERLRDLGVTVRTTSAGSFDEVLRLIRAVGVWADRPEAAADLVRSMERRRTELRGRVAGRDRVPALLVLGREPLHVAGPGTFAHALVRDAGGRNVFGDADTAWPQVSIEAVLGRAPDAIVDASMGPEADPADALDHWARFESIPAVARDRVLAIDPDLVARAGPRLVDGLERIARFLHPGAFGD